MKLSDVKSNVIYHFIDVTCTRHELQECTNWCTDMFGLSNDQNWAVDTRGGHDITSADIAKSFINNGRLYHLRFRFANADHRTMFMLRWA